MADLYTFFALVDVPFRGRHIELIRTFDLASVCMAVDLPVVSLCISPGLEPEQR